MLTRLANGVGALLLLLGLLVGVPVALVSLTGVPFADGVGPILDALTLPDLGGTLLMTTVLPLVAWLAWAYFTVCVLVEAVRLARDGVNRRVVGGAPGRRAASALLSAVVIMVVGAGAVAPATAAEAAVPAFDAPAVSTAIGPAATTPTPATVPQGPAVTVRDGDTLWSLATRYLGDGARYPEIAELNRGVAQHDGTALDDDLWLTPGWRLVLPADAVPPTAPASTTDHTTTPETRVEVRPGDTLWQLAETHLGDGARFPELRGEAGPLDPLTLRPGDIVVVPGPAVGTQSSPEAPVAPEAPDTDPPPVETASPAASTPPPADDATAPPAVEAPTPTVASVEAGASSTSSVSAVSAEGADDAAAAPLLDLRTVGGVGGVLAAGLVTWLSARRLLQRRARRFGERLPMPMEETAAFERELRAASRVAGVEAVDVAVRTLAAWAQDTGTPLPALHAVRLTEHDVALYFGSPVEAPAPFRSAAEDGTAWTVGAGELAAPERIPSAPYPALVSVGHDATGASLFIDLESVGVLSIAGEDEFATASALGIALELTTASWADDIQVTLIGFGEAVADELATDRLRHLPDAGPIIGLLEAQSGHVAAALSELGAGSAGEARGQHPDAEGWSPEVLVIGPGATAEDRERLTRLALQLPRIGVAVLDLGVDDRGWTLRIDDAETATLELAGGIGSIPVVPGLVRTRESARLLELARVAAAPPSAAPARDWTITLETPPRDEPLEVDLGLDEVTEQPAPAPEPGELPPDDLTPEAPPVKGPLAADDDERPDEDQGTSTDPVAAALDELAPSIADVESMLDGDAQWGHVFKPETTAVAPRRPRTRDEPSADAEALELVAGLHGRPWVRLLGPVALVGARGDLPRTPKTDTVNNAAVQRATELTAFLALHPGVSAVQFHHAFWPGRDPRGKTAASSRNGLATRTRKWLGATDDGELYFPHVGAGGYTLHPEVTTDWHVMLSLLGDDLGTTSTARLRLALDLVRGAPFSGVKDRFYGWAEVVRMDMLATIVDTCHEFAQRSLDAGDVAGARKAAALGRDIDPVNEMPWRDALEAELLAGDLDGFDRIVGQLLRQLDDFEDGYEPEPETQELIDEAAARRGRGLRTGMGDAA